MDFGGAMGYPVNRKLTEDEKRHHIDQKQRTKCPPLGSLSVIKMNSTYLECVDKFFHMKGYLTSWMLFTVTLLIYAILFLIFVSVVDFRKIPTPYFFGFALTILFIVPFVYIFSLFIRWEATGLTMYSRLSKRVKTFTKGYTHYPIRFNRKNRKVYAHRLDGTLLIANWDDLYFSIEKEGRSSWSVRAHVLDKDGETVLDTFSLPKTDDFEENDNNPTLYCFFEFVRRYMEEDYTKLPPVIGRTINVANRKQSFIEGFIHLLGYSTAGGPLLIILISAPFALFEAIGRKLAMMLSKIPQWPPEIEAECAIEPNDPYLVDETHPPPA